MQQRYPFSLRVLQSAQNRDVWYFAACRSSLFILDALIQRSAVITLSRLFLAPFAEAGHLHRDPREPRLARGVVRPTCAVCVLWIRVRAASFLLP